MNHKTYPKNYRQVAVMDFVRNRRQMLTVNIAAIVIMIIMIVLGIFLLPFGPTWLLIRSKPWVIALLLLLYIAYIPLHELTHGIFMYALSGVKPKYGLKLCYAYAGSQVYFDRRSHILIALAPLVLLGLILLAVQLAVSQPWRWLIYLLQVSNVSGSAGDVYCVIMLSRYSKDVLIQDTGTRMRIFEPKPSKEEIV